MSNKKNFFYYLLPSIVSGVIGIAILPITTFFLEPADFGVYALLSAFVMPVSSFSSTGAVWVLGAHFFKTEENDRRKLLFNILFLDLLSKLLWLTVVWFLAPILLPLLITEYQAAYILFFRFILISILLNAFSLSISTIFIYQKRARVHAVVEITGPIISSSVTIFCLYYLKLKTIALFIGPLASEVFSVLIGFLFVWRYLSFGFNKQWAKEVIRVGLPAMPLELISLLNNIADRFFIQRWLNISTLGLYAHSQNYRSVFNLGVKSFSRTYCPHAVEKFSTGGDVSVLENWLKKWFGLVAIAGVFTTLFSFEIINLLTHGKFIEAAPLVPLWYLLVIMISYGITYMQFLLAHKKNIYLTASGAVIAVFSIAMTAFGIYKFGLMGAVVAALISNCITQFSFKWYANRNGCPNIGTKHFLMTLSGLVLLYIYNLQFQPSLTAKIILFAVLASIISYKFGFLKYLRKSAWAT